MKNYLVYTILFSLATLVLLIGLNFLPTLSFGGVDFRRFNVLSDILSEEQLRQWANLEPYDMAEKNLDQVDAVAIDSVEQRNIVENLDVTKDTVNDKKVQKQQARNITQEITDNSKTETIPIPERTNIEEGVEPIENFGSADFSRFITKMKAGNEVSIAVLGDSFIEGDFFTQDLREALQLKYGGNGVGYMPITSQVAGFRRTVAHSFDGWSTKSILNSPSGEDYLLSGYVFTPEEKAWVLYKGSNLKKGLSSFNGVSLLFVNNGESQIKVTINDSITENHTPTASNQLQTLNIPNENIRSIKFQFSNVKGFKCYGAMLGSGVRVDNYSVRSYSGFGLANLSYDLVQQAENFADYDLVILQYGLNVVEQEVTRYPHYEQQMKAVINNLKKVMPQTALMIMSVSDRQNRASNSTWKGVVALENVQRSIASNENIAFWSTLRAMQKAGGMGYFVQKGWAAKDYTHLSSSGGKVIANGMLEALMNAN